MKSIRRVVADEGVDKSSWWYYFKKSEDGNYAKCNSCDWVKDRGAARSTSILRCHLKAKHPELLTEKLQADKELGGNKFKRQVSKKIKLEAGEAGGGSGNDGEEEEEVLGESQERKDIGASPAQSQVSLSELLEQTFSPVKIEHQNKKQEDNIDEEQLLKQTNDFNNALLSMIAADFVSNSATTNANQQPGTSGSNVHSRNVAQTNKKGTSGRTAIAETAGHFTWAGQKPPIVQLRRKEHFSSAHRLHNPKFDAELNAQLFGKCNNANGHGHNYCWEVVLQGEVDASTGMVYNLVDLKQEMASVLALVDHKNLDLDVAYFSENSVVSTTENLAIFLYHELAARMTRPELLKEVLVGETSKNSFIYSGPSNSCSI